MRVCNINNPLSNTGPSLIRTRCDCTNPLNEDTEATFLKKNS